MAVARDKKTGSPKKRVLADHKQVGKTFMPPFLAGLGPEISEKLGTVSWIDDLLPELIWIAVLVDSFPERRAAELTLACGQETERFVRNDRVKQYAFAFAYRGVTPEQAHQIRKALAVRDVLNDLQSSLWPLVSLYADCPLAFLFDDRALQTYKVPLDKSLARLKSAVWECLDDRRGRQSMIVQTAALATLVATGALHIPDKFALGNLNAITRYPDTDESRAVAASVRAALNAMHGLLSDEKGHREWCQYFWRHGYLISVCEFPSTPSAPATLEKESLDRLTHVLKAYKLELSEEIRDCWNRYQVDLAEPKRAEVLSALVARQSRLATMLVTDPVLWAVDLSRITLRCMVETHINLKWLATIGRDEDLDNFIEYGLGQEKLFLEHLELRTRGSDSVPDEYRGQLDTMRGWVDSQLRTDFLPVNVADWTRKTMRERATETNLLDDYNLSYTPFSSVLHGMWNAIAQMNLKVCRNPLHRLHRVPSTDDLPITVEAPRYAASLMDESLTVWADALGIALRSKSASEKFMERLDKWLSGSDHGEPGRQARGKETS